MTSPELAGGQPIDYDHYLDTYGLGPEELNSTVTYNNLDYTLAQMLDSCPLGKVVADAYASEGFAGLTAKLGEIKTFSPDFNVPISEGTRSYHDGSSSRETLLAQTPVAETRDFLV